MNLLFRVDASTSLASGHVTRCLTLASYAGSLGSKSVFVCRAERGNMIDLIQERGFGVESLPPSEPFDEREDAAATLDAISRLTRPPDSLIVDHYRLGRAWETSLRKAAHRLMVIDDRADRPHECDILLDQNLVRNFERRYDGLVPSPCRLFLGPRYAILRPEFREAALKSSVRESGINTILLFFGGSDESGETLKVLHALKALQARGKCGCKILVLVGNMNPRALEIQRFCKTVNRTHFYHQVHRIAELINQADLAFGACGTSSWERCCLGLPAAVTILAENQKEITACLAELGAVWNLGPASDTTPESYRQKLQELISAPEKIADASRRAFEVIPHGGSSGIDEVLNALLATSD